MSRWRAAVKVVTAVIVRASATTGARAMLAVEIPAADTSARRSTRSGNWIATSDETKPPIEFPTRCARSISSSSSTARTKRP